MWFDNLEEKPKSTLKSIWDRSWLPLTGACVVAGLIGFYTVTVFTATFFPSNACCIDDISPDEIPTGRPPAFDASNAEEFDRELDLSETLMRISRLRKKIADRATGNVLEIAMGGGRNLKYYHWDALNEIVQAAQVLQERLVHVSGLSAAQEEDIRREVFSAIGPKRKDGITSFTGLDISVDMLDIARKRLVDSVPPMQASAPVVRSSTMSDHTGGQLSFLSDRIRLVHSDAHHPIPRPSQRVSGATDAKYDTIIQTFGLCSVSDPVGVLKNMASVLKPETGRIVLLEHGRGWLGLVNGLLDRNATKHFAKYGCWWNRDIEGLAELACESVPGLEIVEVKRPNMLQLGTLVWIELKVKEGGTRDEART